MSIKATYIYRQVPGRGLISSDSGPDEPFLIHSSAESRKTRRNWIRKTMVIDPGGAVFAILGVFVSWPGIRCTCHQGTKTRRKLSDAAG
jgi:hypothetical protein